MVLHLLKPSLGGFPHEEGKKKEYAKFQINGRDKSHLLTAWKEGAL